MPSYLKKEKSGRVLLLLWVQPGASRSEWAGLHGERLKIRLKSPPVDGRANLELIRFLSQELNLKAGELKIVAGLSSRQKTVSLPAGFQDVLAEALSSGS
jgi:uncharacterized protein